MLAVSSGNGDADGAVIPSPLQPMEVIGAGFGRTGTMSLQAALNILLAPKKCYHYGSIIQDGHFHLWKDALLEGRSPDWVQILEQNAYVATMDHPCAEYWKDLMQKYPNAKVILSEHPGGMEGWYKSKLALENMEQVMFHWASRPFSSVLWKIAMASFSREDRGEPEQDNVLSKVSYSHSEMVDFAKITENNVWGERGIYDPFNAMQKYEARYKEVKAVVPADRLLVFNVSMGWGPLCEFLGKPVPDVPFPREDFHGTKNLQKITKRMQAFLYSFYSLMVLGVAGGVGAMRRSRL